MDASSRQDKIESYGQAHRLLLTALERFPREMWLYKPDENSWSIHEIIIHITDSEANSYIRCRRLIAEPQTSLMAYDENKWARALRYPDQDPMDALELFRWLRKQSYELLKKQPIEVWGNQVYHPESGMMTMDDWLDTYERHIPEHIDQMMTVYESWRKMENENKHANDPDG